MFHLLKKPMSVSDIVKMTGMEQSAVSHHLKRLKLCSFVQMKADGKERIYSVNEETVEPLFRLMDKHASKYCKHLCCSPSSQSHG